MGNPQKPFSREETYSTSEEIKNFLEEGPIKSNWNSQKGGI